MNLHSQFPELLWSWRFNTLTFRHIFFLMRMMIKMIWNLDEKDLGTTKRKLQKYLFAIRVLNVDYKRVKNWINSAAKRHHVQSNRGIWIIKISQKHIKAETKEKTRTETKMKILSATSLISQNSSVLWLTLMWLVWFKLAGKNRFSFRNYPEHFCTSNQFISLCM